MSPLGQILSNYRGIPDQQLLCVFNPVSGVSRSDLRNDLDVFTTELQSYLGSSLRFAENRYEVSRLETIPDRHENIRRIAEAMGQLASNGRPLRVLCFGGDGTFDLVLGGYLTYLAGSFEQLLSLSQEELAKRFKECPIRLGIVSSGSANDIAALYGGPKKNLSGITKFLATAVDANLHLGVATVYREEGAEIWPFVHSFAAGHVFTPVIVESQKDGRRGREAMMWMARHGIGRIFGKAEKRTLNWKRSDGTSGAMFAQDAMAHALPRLGLVIGLPGLKPFEGIGFKVVPETGLASRMVIGAELFGSGLLSRIGRLKPLQEGARLVTVPENHQLSLDVGQWIEYFYSQDDGKPSPIGYQVSGDGIGYTNGPIRIQALPPVEHFLMSPGAPMGRLLFKNLTTKQS